MCWQHVRGIRMPSKGKRIELMLNCTKNKLARGPDTAYTEALLSVQLTLRFLNLQRNHLTTIS